jgi:acyl-CoA synthetase (AMP-forming)/AMP-acid ligase II
MASTGRAITYREMEESANRFARLLRQRGLQRGDHVAVMLDNDPHYLEVVWGALRSGVYVTPINWHLGPGEVGYIVEDCEASVLVTSSRFAANATQLAQRLGRVHTRLSMDGPFDGFEDYEASVRELDGGPVPDETCGAVMFYSSGTTGRPKGIKPPLGDEPYGAPVGMEMLLDGLYGVTEESRYLVPAPLYHAAPLVWSLAVHRLGGTVIVMDRFDAVETLADIEKYRVTHAQFVPTHFIRMLKLPEDERRRHDLSSLCMAVHAAAPCPVEVKRAMLDWWGPIIYEYYAGSESNGYCSASPEEWLEHPGTAGRSILGSVHAVREDGQEAAVGEVGQLWFDGGAVFEYHNDPDKTAEAFNTQGWSTLGDVGYLDEDGFVYLTDRTSHMIISGGVNIYPQEVENLLAMHPAIFDVAVIGVPDEDFGEAVKAVVQLAPGYSGDEATAQEIITYCQANLAKFKCPRSVDFMDELPRLPSGKLLKRKLRQRYWQT